MFWLFGLRSTFPFSSVWNSTYSHFRENYTSPTKHSENVVAWEGDLASLPCSLSSSSPDDKPTLVLWSRWRFYVKLRNNTIVLSGKRSRTRMCTLWTGGVLGSTGRTRVSRTQLSSPGGKGTAGWTCTLFRREMRASGSAGPVKVHFTIFLLKK